MPTVFSLQHPWISWIKSLDCRSMEPTRTPDRNSGRPRLTISIIAVAVFQIVGSVRALVKFECGVRIFCFSDQSSVTANAPFVLCTLLGAAFTYVTWHGFRGCLGLIVPSCSQIFLAARNPHPPRPSYTFGAALSSEQRHSPCVPRNLGRRASGGAGQI
jgi:hypothetical protein